MQACFFSKIVICIIICVQNRNYKAQILFNMKTLKISFLILTVAILTTCGSQYKMVTTIDRHGKANREIYAFGKFDTVSKMMSKNPYMFDFEKDWDTAFFTLTKFDTHGSEKGFNMKISKRVTSIAQYTKELQGYNENQMLAVPEESLVKKTGWFYTKYSFKTVYHQYKYTMPVSIDEYLNKEEQILWSQGGLDNYKSYSGSEMSEYLNTIGDKYLEWIFRNFFEISLETIKKYSDKYDFEGEKDEVHKKVKELVKEAIDVNPEKVCEGLDIHFKTTYFSKLYNNNSESMNQEFEEATSVAGLLLDEISYELVIPGKLLQTNTPIIESGTLKWKVDGFRLLFDDYTLTAEYRVANRWAFVLTGLLVLVAGGGMVIIRHKKYTL